MSFSIISYEIPEIRVENGVKWLVIFYPLLISFIPNDDMLPDNDSLRSIGMNINKKRIKFKALVFLLLTVILLSTIPMTAFGDETEITKNFPPA